MRLGQKAAFATLHFNKDNSAHAQTLARSSNVLPRPFSHLVCAYEMKFKLLVKEGKKREGNISKEGKALGSYFRRLKFLLTRWTVVAREFREEKGVIPAMYIYMLRLPTERIGFGGQSVSLVCFYVSCYLSTASYYYEGVAACSDNCWDAFAQWISNYLTKSYALASCSVRANSIHVHSIN